MTQSIFNRWTLDHYKEITVEVVKTIQDELEANIAGINKPHILTNQNEVYALASRFKNALYKYPYFMKKHHKILSAIIDRCGEAYSEKDIIKLYISNEKIKEWGSRKVFKIGPENMNKYLDPLVTYQILKPSDKPEYVYSIDENFFHLVGPAATYLFKPPDPKKFAEMMAVASGISSIYVMSRTSRINERILRGPLIPWFVKLPMLYTLTGLDPFTLRINNELELDRIDATDNYFVKQKGYSAELWRSIRMEAFEFMTDNKIIEEASTKGYTLNTLWVRMHEEGARRYIMRFRERIQKRYKGS